jgi:hypothetical protein
MIGLAAYLSGAADATTDYAFAVVTLGLTKRNGSNSYYSVTSPYSAALLDALGERPNGTLHLLKIVDGVPQAWEYCNLNAVQYSLGAYSQTVTLTGYRQSTNASPATVTVPESSVENAGRDAQGRLLLDMVAWSTSAVPGDTIIWREAYYTLTLAAWQAGPRGWSLTYTAEMQT